jgi:hypothetical protein
MNIKNLLKQIKLNEDLIIKSLFIIIVILLLWKIINSSQEGFTCSIKKTEVISNNPIIKINNTPSDVDSSQQHFMYQHKISTP